jgi:predicted porin
MKTTLIAAALCGLFATQASAIELHFGTDGSVVSTNGEATSAAELNVGLSHGFGGVTALSGVTYDVVANDVSGFYVGANIGDHTTVTYGDQDGAFSFTGGLNKISGNVLAAPAQPDRSVLVTGLSYSASLGFNDGEVENVQAVYNIPTFNGITTDVGVDYNTVTDETTFGIAADTKINNVALGAIVTYADDYAVELNAGYDNARAFTTFNADGLDVAGVGYDYTVSKNASMYVEAGYDFNTEETSAAVGMSLSF